MQASLEGGVEYVRLIQLVAPRALRQIFSTDAMVGLYQPDLARLAFPGTDDRGIWDF
jgi:hypothetical protein